jgi:chemotaxis protein MotA
MAYPTRLHLRLQQNRRELGMFAIIGIVVVFGCVVAGYLMEHGNLRVLVQPAELIIIGGAAIGTLLVANPLHILKKIAGGIAGVFGGSKFGRQTYIDTLKMMYDLLNKARKDGLMALESDVEEPQKSTVFIKNPAFLKNHHVCDFVCDSLRMAITGIDAFDLDQMLDLDLEVHHQDSSQPTAALSTMADSLPGLGIVAAVLGVVITMGALGGPPEEIGNKVAAALVGTFLGILLCYGLVGPIASNMTKAAEEEHAFLYVMRVLMVSFLKGTAPIMAVEMARRAVPGHVRPSFQELEKACRNRAPDASADGASPDPPAASPADSAAEGASASS